MLLWSYVKIQIIVNGFLTRKMFMWIMGLFVLAFTTVLGYTIGKVDDNADKFNHNFTQVTNSISSLETSIDFIKEDIKDTRENIKDIKDILTDI